MKKKVIAIFVAMLMLASSVLITTAATTPAAAGMTGGKITVNGQGVIKVAPDIAYVTLGVLTRDADAKKAQEANSKTMTAVIATIKAQGVAEKNIKTSQYYMYPEYDYTSNDQKITAYAVSNSVTVTVTAIDTTGKIIDAGIAAGANNANNVSFGIADSAAYYDQALGLAVANAKTKSQAIAKALEVKVGNPIEVNESSYYYAPLAKEAMNMRTEMDAGAGAEMPIQATELEITANVTCVFPY